jgi:hypothetical protein
MLEAKAKVPMTRIPLQNEYCDSQSMMAFMHVKPWDEEDKFSKGSTPVPSGIVF